MLRNALVSSLLASTAFGAAIRPRASSWTPQVGEKWQIILSGNPEVSGGLVPEDATVWDLDLFNADAETISSIKSQGKGVICYFSAGTSEPDRPDLGGLDSSNKGAELPDWPGENWLDIRSDNVVQIMTARIQTAAQKGCDAVDPDNMDGYSNENGGGFSNPLTQEDSVAFFQKMADAAQQSGLLIGLKNAEEIIPSVSNIAQFAVNEECASTGDCSAYDSFGKPVYHIEYPNGGAGGGDGGDGSDGSDGSDGDNEKKKTHKPKPKTGKGAPKKKAASDLCVSNASFSTVLKNLSLDGYVEYCDGETATTPTSGDNSKKNA